LRQAGGWRGPVYGVVNWLARQSLPSRPLRLVSLQDNFIIRNGWMDFERLEKKISREYLSWYCRWAGKAFVGCVDDESALTSYLIIETDHYGRHQLLSVIDHFTTRKDNGELLALLRRVLADTDNLALKGRFDFLMLNLLEDVFGGQKPLGAIHRQNLGLHHYSLPEPLHNVTKRCVIAEGDYGC
jgi:hypothetical protein